jgi:hypothetical protein
VIQYTLSVTTPFKSVTEVESPILNYPATKNMKMALEFPYASSVMLFGIPPSKAIQ